MIGKYIEDVKAGKIDLKEETKKTLNLLEKLNYEYNFFSVITKDLAFECVDFVLEKLADGKAEDLPLAGVFVSVKDCVCIKGVESSASSKILKNYLPVFNATVIEKIKSAGGIIVGKTIQDEFGFGSFSVNTGLDFPVPKNPNDLKRVAGGSSGGCGTVTKLAEINNIPHISIAESTGGSIECPASFCGVIGFCPTYGKVSRNGLISYANSLDKIGIMGTSCEEVKMGINVISGEDSKDSTSVKTKEINLKDKKANDFSVGYIDLPKINNNVKKVYEEKLSKLKEAGVKLEKIEMPITFKYALSSYYIIAMSEASTNLSCLCGLRYGLQEQVTGKHFAEYFSGIRSNYFGEEAKRRIILGTFTRMAGYRDAFYIRAAKVRTKIIEEYKEKFKEYDLIISPTMPFVAPRFEDIEKIKPVEHYMADILTVGPNLAGMPHMSFPIGVCSETKNEGDDDKIAESLMPVGLMITANHFNESKILEFGIFLENLDDTRTILGGKEI